MDREVLRICRIPCLWLLSLVLIVSFAFAQASPSLQIFMPDGSLPVKEVRFHLTTDDGRVDIFFTDSKGRFYFTRTEGLRPDARYTITVEGDGKTFETTTVTFKEFGVYYIPIFLSPLQPKARIPGPVVHVSDLDDRVPPQARAHHQAGMRHARAGDMSKGVEELIRAIEVYPDYFEALNDLGVMYMKQNLRQEATACFKRASAISPRAPHPRVNLAIVLTREGDYESAVRLLSEVHRQNPGLMEVRVPYADALMAVRRLDEAEGQLRAALADPQVQGEARGDAYYKLGLLLNMRQHFDEAAVELSRAVEILPESGRSHLQLGGALLQAGQLDRAEAALTTATRLGLDAAHLLLGQLHHMRKNYAAALQSFEHYLRSFSDAPNAPELRRIVEEIRAALRK